MNLWWGLKYQIRKHWFFLKFSYSSSLKNDKIPCILILSVICGYHLRISLLLHTLTFWDSPVPPTHWPPRVQINISHSTKKEFYFNKKQELDLKVPKKAWDFQLHATQFEGRGMTSPSSARHVFPIMPRGEILPATDMTQHPAYAANVRQLFISGLSDLRAHSHIIYSHLSLCLSTKLHKILDLSRQIKTSVSLFLLIH